MTLRTFSALVVFFVGLIDFQRFTARRHRQQRQLSRQVRQEAIMTWEGEGGNLPPQDIGGLSNAHAPH